MPNPDIYICKIQFYHRQLGFCLWLWHDHNMTTEQETGELKYEFYFKI